MQGFNIFNINKIKKIMQKIYDFKAFSSKGKEIDFSQFQGKVLLIVNTASKCGFTPQFAGLDLQPVQGAGSRGRCSD